MIKTTNDISGIPEDAVLAFTATWCSPCTALKPQLVKAAGKTNRDIFVVDIDEVDPSVLDFYRVQSVPTVVRHEPDGFKYVVGRLEESILDEIGRK